MVDTNRQKDGNNTFEQFDENHDFDQIDGNYTLENYMEKGGSVGPLECKFFSTLHGSLWLGKDKGSIMESAESGGTIHLDLHRMDTLVTIR